MTGDKDHLSEAVQGEGGTKGRVGIKGPMPKVNGMRVTMVKQGWPP